MYGELYTTENMIVRRPGLRVSLETLLWGSLLLLSVVHSRPTNDSKIGYFWQITDIHYDPFYSAEGDRSTMCHKATDGHTPLGEFGEAGCDSPLRLAQSAIRAMADIESKPDFIFWTGDNAAHLKDSEVDLEKILEIMKNVTDTLIASFPNTTIYPVLGNHDIYPAQDMPPYDNGFYKKVLHDVGWDRLLDAESQAQFKTSGYYSTLIKPGLRLIGLNTVIYYPPDILVKNGTDPDGQLKWLDTALQQAKEKAEKTVIIAHIPPGILPSYHRWFESYKKPFNQKYLDIVLAHSDTINTQIYGHSHTDSFHIYYNSNGVPVNSGFIAPSVTPIGGNNPTVRLYKYERATGRIVDIFQYFLNRTEANMRHEANWTLEYQATHTYGLADMSIHSLDKLANSFKAAHSETFAKYVKHFSASQDMGMTCNDTCKKIFICAATKMVISEFDKCIGIKTPSSDESPAASGKSSVSISYYMNYIIGVFAVIIIILLIVLIILFVKRRTAQVHNRYSTLPMEQFD